MDMTIIEQAKGLADKVLAQPATEHDIAVVERQLGRYPRGMVAVGARCVCGRPLAVVTRPLLPGGVPFPTTCYLTGPEAVKAISHIEAEGKMKEYNDSLFAERHKPPHLHFNEYNSYRFETPDDTGTGSNYKGMVIFDLAVLNLTALPAIAHDSLILKNISDGSIDGIMKIYADSKKQIFIAFDKQDAYTTETRKIVTDNKVLKLSDNHCELYGESWNVEEAQSENKL